MESERSRKDYVGELLKDGESPYQIEIQGNAGKRKFRTSRPLGDPTLLTQPHVTVLE